MNSRPLQFVLIALLMGIALLYAAWQAFGVPHTFQGSVIEPALTAQDFSLVDSEGKVFRLADQRGRVVVLFFGYTNCPDFCPTTMAELRQLRDALADEFANVRVVFITTDPERDTPEVAAQFAAAFSPDFIGLSGSVEELSPIWQSFYVARNILPVSEGASSYLVEHSTRVIVVDKEGNFRMTFPYGLGAAAMESDIRYLISE